jgi:hypothetical protein
MSQPDTDLEYLAWKRQKEESERKSGLYWVSPEGRAEIKDLWPDWGGQNVVRPLLDTLEKAEERIEALVKAGDALQHELNLQLLDAASGRASIRTAILLRSWDAAKALQGQDGAK